MKLGDTVEGMVSANYEDRFVAEYKQLQIRMKGLDEMLDAYARGTLPFEPKCSYTMLNHQLQSMQEYYKILVHRATVENITLS